ncbi:MAG: V-type ATP synthase subunit D [Candidatus Methanoliparum thermophilum]|uniref:A-type ATP synthase subunit D n=1 Tax=Methanoliparum thermophilum TaxID=2491083 RepID=A0A520KR81_METT2|nr:V-type ATP synthase subunit D [Candidatus Methanoliparum sp. LAM-1]RZN63864.1 MAG: V-type ATP synthase subunit D [Candidatus Methanoliparum thermophilum]BDC36410.1 ATP synthase subunit D [Candidatus Methanoliparum sp. LAM-1]
MSEIIEGTKPTRMELLNLKRREKLAEKGYKLLKEKRDALILEFLNIVKEVRTLRREAEKALEEAYKDLLIVQAELGVFNVKQIADIIPPTVEINFYSRNIMGVSVPNIEIPETTRTIMERGYGLLDTSSRLDDTAKKFEWAIKKLIMLAEIEGTVIALGEEVEKTKRRVNSLEYIMIPKLSATVRYISMRLEEMERENIPRLKKIKKILEEKKELREG